MNVTTLEFLKAFYNPEQEIAVRSYKENGLKLEGVVKDARGYIRCNSCGRFMPQSKISPKRALTPTCYDCTPKMRKFKLSEWPQHEKTFRYYNTKHGHGVHFSINCAHFDKECKKVFAQFFEIDDKSFEEQFKLIRDKSKIQPSIIVKTRKSLHVYYLIKDGDIKRFRTIQKKLACLFSSDSQKISESTCMRLPGFYHNKKDPLMVNVIEFHPENIYTQDEVEGWLPELPQEPRRQYEDGGYIELTGNMLEDLCNMMKSHIRNYIDDENDRKIIMHCILSGHKDKSASAVIFKDKLNYYCKGCGASMSGYELAKQMGWRDVTTTWQVYYKELMAVKRG